MIKKSKKCKWCKTPIKVIRKIYCSNSCRIFGKRKRDQKYRDNLSKKMKEKRKERRKKILSEGIIETWQSEEQDRKAKETKETYRKVRSSKADEAEEYALEYLAPHIAIESQLDNNYDSLHDFVNNENLWKRQVALSNEYKFKEIVVFIDPSDMREDVACYGLEDDVVVTKTGYQVLTGKVPKDPDEIEALMAAARQSEAVPA